MTAISAVPTSTAAVISPVGRIGFRGRDYTVNGGQVGPWARKFYDTLTGIQYGELEDRRGWVYAVR